MKNSYEARRHSMARRLQREGIIRTPLVVEAMTQVPRHLFLPDRLKDSAYYDTPLSIGSGQTISAPHMVGMMLEYLDLTPGHIVLEVGAGSGYHAALAGYIAGPEGHVYSIERIDSLAHQARRNIEEAGLGQCVTVIVGDGSLGLAEHAPFDRIFITCAAPEIPPPLVEELAEGGKFLIPLGSRYYQDLVLLERRGQELLRKNLGGCVFVPLIGKYGF